MELDIENSNKLEYPRQSTSEDKTSFTPSLTEICEQLKKSIEELNENIANSSEPRTLLYSNVRMIYPIDSWTFWFRDFKKMQSRKPWEESLTKIGTVSDVDHLWKFLNLVIRPSEKHLFMSIFVFKERSVPAWEHKSNENAGRWIIVLNDNHNLHNAWNNMILQVVGDKFAAVVDDINGIGIHVKPLGSRITVWTTKVTLENYKNIINIGVMSQKTIGKNMVKRMFYSMHKQIQKITSQEKINC